MYAPSPRKWSQPFPTCSQCSSSGQWPWELITLRILKTTLSSWPKELNLNHFKSRTLGRERWKHQVNLLNLCNLWFFKHICIWLVEMGSLEGSDGQVYRVNPSWWSEPRAHCQRATENEHSEANTSSLQFFSGKMCVAQTAHPRLHSSLEDKTQDVRDFSFLFLRQSPDLQSG